MAQKIPESNLREDLEQVIDTVGRTPTTAEYKEHGSYGLTTIIRRLGDGSWNDAIRALGYEPRDRMSTTQKDVREDFERVVTDFGRVPTATEYREHGEYSRATLIERYGDDGWAAAVRNLGYEPLFDAPTAVPEDALRADFERVIELLGHRPTMAEYDGYGDYGAVTLAKRFGERSWNDAVRALGYEPANPAGKIPEQVLLTDLESVADKVGDVPTVHEYDEHGTYSAATIARRLGDSSWTDAVARLDRETDTATAGDRDTG